MFLTASARGVKFSLVVFLIVKHLKTYVIKYFWKIHEHGKFKWPKRVNR